MASQKHFKDAGMLRVASTENQGVTYSSPGITLSGEVEGEVSGAVVAALPAHSLAPLVGGKDCFEWASNAGSLAR